MKGKETDEGSGREVGGLGKPPALPGPISLSTFHSERVQTKKRHLYRRPQLRLHASTWHGGASWPLWLLGPPAGRDVSGGSRERGG